MLDRWHYCYCPVKFSFLFVFASPAWSRLSCPDPTQERVDRHFRFVGLLRIGIDQLGENVAITAPHEFITARMERIADCHQELQALVGEPAATQAVAKALEQAGNEDEA